MKSLPSYQRILLFLLSILLLTCLISPWMAVGADWTWRTFPEWLDERVPFHRVFDRAFMVAGIVTFTFCRRFLLIDSWASLGISGVAQPGRHYSIGLALSIASMVLLASAMSAANIFTPYFRLPLSESISRCASALAAGVFIGFVEELFFRGILLRGLLASGTIVRAFVLANLYYAAMHFIEPGQSYFMDTFNPLIGFRHLLTTFHAFADPLTLLPGFTSLFLLGLVLSHAYVRTGGNLYLSIGLHTGWIFSIKSLRVFGDYSRDDLGLLFGATDPKIVSGIATWIGIALVGVAVHLLTANSSRLLQRADADGSTVGERNNPTGKN